MRCRGFRRSVPGVAEVGNAARGRSGPANTELLARVRSLHLVARRLVVGVRTGSHLAAQRGFEAEFLGYRPYFPPHPLKDVDWRVYARTDRLVVRERRAERELACTLVLDASADLGSTPAKWQCALEVTAALAFAVLANGDPVGLCIGAGVGMTEANIPARRARGQLARILLALASTRPAGRAELATLFTRVGERARGRTLVGVVSDFMEDPAQWRGALAAMARRQIDLRGVLVFDRAELDLVGDDPARLVSPETGLQFPIDPAAVRLQFSEVVGIWREEVRSAMVARRALLYPLAAEDPRVPALAAWLAGRALPAPARS